MEKEIQPVPATWMEFEGIKLSELSQTEKHKYCIISLICEIWKKKNDITDTEKRFVVTRSGGIPWWLRE